MGRVDVVVGGQYGSEAKGHVTAQIARRRHLEGNQVHVVRVAGPNAGHTAYGCLDGEPWALRTIPCAAVENLETQLYIAAGSEIDEHVLDDEITRLDQAGYQVTGRLYIDRQATVLTELHHNTEQNLDIHNKLGSTGKGIGAARAARIMREAPVWGHHPDTPGRDTADMLRRVLMQPRTSVIIEGTQGYGLGLHAGAYPFCTSSDCRAIDFLAMAGISPWYRYISMLDVWVVARTFPIRVAGNSGPLANETTWRHLAEITGGYIKPERTTVTKKIRRVGYFDERLVHEALLANGWTLNSEDVHLALTFADYIDPTAAGVTDPEIIREQRHTLVDWMMDQLPTMPHLITTGPDTAVWNDGYTI